MLLSIVIIVYNCVTYLPALLSDVHLISGEDVEIILVDDGSFDGSTDVCQDWETKDSRFRLIRQNNSGPSVARNTGLKSATGQYVAFFDSDDRVDSTGFMRLLSYLRCSQQADVWCSDYYRIYRNGVILNRVFRIDPTEKPVFDNALLPEFLGAPLWMCYWNVWRFVFRRSFLQEHALFFIQGYQYGEDMEFITRCFLADPQCAFYHNPYYYYVATEGSLMNRSSMRRIQDTVTMLCKALDAVERYGHGSNATEMKRRLCWEYIANLTQLYDIPYKNRREAASFLKNHAYVLSTSPKWRDRFLKLCIDIVGVSFVATTLYGMRSIRRLINDIRYHHETNRVRLFDC